MRLTRAVVLIGLTAALLRSADGRRKLWDLDLSKITKYPAEQVWGIRFSPDETKVAIGFGPRWSFDARPRHIVVLAVDQPQTVLRDFELNTPGQGPFSRNIVWSPSATLLVAAILPKPLMLRLDDKAACVFPEDSTFGGFLSGDRVVISLRAPGSKITQAETRILNPDCSLADSWKADAGVKDTSPEQDLLAIATFPKPPESPVVELIAPLTHEVRQRLTGRFAGDFAFSDQGSLLCGAKNREGKPPLPDLACWDTQTGAKIVENQEIALDMWGPTLSAGGNLLAMTDYKYISRDGSFWQVLDMSGYWVPKRSLIWNVRTGKEVASWGARQQKELLGSDLKTAQTKKTNFVISLSPTGKYVAEGGSGVVSVYALQP
jgi:hypothetical protein